MLSRAASDEAMSSEKDERAISTPTPAVACANSATTAPISAVVSPIFRPANISGNAAGTRSWVKT